MYHFLVIDDELEWREAAYREFLEPNFLLTFIGRPDLTLIEKKINDPEISAVILDMVLDWDKRNQEGAIFSKEAFEVMLELIGRKKPIIIISRQLTQVASWLKGNTKGENCIIDFLGWDEVWTLENKIKGDVTKSSFCLRFEWNLNEYFNKTQSLKEPDEIITILHTPDLQFGDPNMSENMFLSETVLAKTLLNDYDIRPDFIVITGDITHQGLPSEFLRAKDWINTLSSQIFPSTFKNKGERILLVPGNHDVNLALSSVDAYEYNFNNLAKDGKATENKYLISRETPLTDHGAYGLMPFCEFAYSVTQDDIWFEQANNLNWINDKFSMWGLRFVHLNSVSELNYKDIKKVSLDERAIFRLGTDFVKGHNPELFTIYLCHNGPYEFGFNITHEFSPEFIKLTGLFNAVECDLFLYGHLHESLDYYRLPSGDPKITKIAFIQSGTISLNKENRREDTRRSFSVVRLERKSGKVLKIEITIFEYEGYQITKKKTYNVS